VGAVSAIQPLDGLLEEVAIAGPSVCLGSLPTREGLFALSCILHAYLRPGAFWSR